MFRLMFHFGRQITAKTIALLNMKGGVAKTTLAVNLAWHCYEKGRKRVLLVDLDPQFNASQYLMAPDDWEEHRHGHGTLADLLIDQAPRIRGGKDKAKTIEDCIATVERPNAGDHRFDILPSELQLGHIVRNPSQMEYKLEKRLRSVRDAYDYIFIDCAPTDSVLTTMAMTASNFILIPVRPDRFSILGFGLVKETIRRFKDNSHDPNSVKELGLVFTQVRDPSGLEGDCKAEIRLEARKNESYVFASELKFSSTIIRAQLEGTPIFNTKYARDELKNSISDIASEMEGRIAFLETPRGEETE